MTRHLGAAPGSSTDPGRRDIRQEFLGIAVPSVTYYVLPVPNWLPRDVDTLSYPLELDLSMGPIYDSFSSGTQ